MYVITSPTHEIPPSTCTCTHNQHNLIHFCWDSKHGQNTPRPQTLKQPLRRKTQLIMGEEMEGKVFCFCFPEIGKRKGHVGFPIMDTTCYVKMDNDAHHLKTQTKFFTKNKIGSLLTLVCGKSSFHTLILSIQCAVCCTVNGNCSTVAQHPQSGPSKWL